MTRLALGDVADAGDLRVHLAAGQHAADAGFRALGQLQRHALHGVVRGFVGELGLVEIAVGGAAAEVAGADLPDEVAAVPQVVLRQAAFAGVVGEPAERGALVEGQDRVRGQRAETHRRHVEQRHVVGLRAVGTADPDLRRVVGRRHRGHRVHEGLVPVGVDVAFGPERLFGVGALGALVDDAADVPVVRAAVEVALDEVLLQLGAQRFEQEPQVPEDRVVPQDRVLALGEIPAPHAGEQEQRHGEQPPPRAGEQGERGDAEREQRQHRHRSESEHGTEANGATRRAQGEHGDHAADGAFVRCAARFTGAVVCRPGGRGIRPA